MDQTKNQYYVYPGGELGEKCVNTLDGFRQRFAALVDDWGEGSVDECMATIVPFADYEDDRETILRMLTERACGERYDSPRAEGILGLADWSDYYPEVDNEGKLTGTVVGSQESGYGNVNGSAMVDMDDLKPGQCQNEDGYVNLGLPPLDHSSE